MAKAVTRYEAWAAEWPDEHGMRACRNIEGLIRLRGVLERCIDAEIIRAREQGATWSTIPYGRSKQAAQQRHAAAMSRRPVKRH